MGFEARLGLAPWSSAEIEAVLMSEGDGDGDGLTHHTNWPTEYRSVSVMIGHYGLKSSIQPYLGVYNWFSLVCSCLFYSCLRSWYVNWMRICYPQINFASCIDLGKFHHDLTNRPKPIDDGECKGNHPLLWPTYSGEWIIIIHPDRWYGSGCWGPQGSTDRICCVGPIFCLCLRGRKGWLVWWPRKIKVQISRWTSRRPMVRPGGIRRLGSVPPAW